MAEIAEVVAKLLDRTDQGRIAWKPADNNQTFAAVIGDTKVTISYVFEVKLTILDESGHQIYMLDSLQSPKWLGDLMRLHESARRHALGVEEKLGELLRALDSV